MSTDPPAGYKMIDAYVVVDEDGFYRCDRPDIYDGSLFPADVSFVTIEEGRRIIAAEPGSTLKRIVAYISDITT